MTELWNRLVADISSNPRDFHTRPLRNNKNPLWFHAFVKNGDLYVTNAAEHKPSSQITYPRKLTYRTFTKIYPIHKRRESGESVSYEATSITVNQVYYYALIHECLDT